MRAASRASAGLPPRQDSNSARSSPPREGPPPGQPLPPDSREVDSTLEVLGRHEPEAPRLTQDPPESSKVAVGRGRAVAVGEGGA